VTLTGGRADRGGGGADILIAGPGRDILIADHPKRGKGDPQGGSILVAGETAYDANDAALNAIMFEWASRRPRLARVHNLLNGRGSRHRLNGSVFLNAKTIKYQRTDTIVGDNRYDWFRLGRRSNKPYVPLRDCHQLRPGVISGRKPGRDLDTDVRNGGG
jgi:hypothetical protein